MQDDDRAFLYFRYQHEFDSPGNDYYEEDAVHMDLETALETELPIIFGTYIAHQREYLTMEAVSELESGYNRLTTPGKRIKGDMRIYLELCKFVALCRSLSGNEADELVRMIKRITRLHGAEVPFPQTYKEIQKNVMVALMKHKIPILQTEFELPYEMFGPNPHTSGFYIFPTSTMPSKTLNLYV